jgi:ABC-type bacteriocin/lantibiotic exporter with double-glycine peptidase domain
MRPGHRFTPSPLTMLSQTITTLVAERMGLEPLSRAATADIARLALNEATPAGLLASILDAGSRAGISYVRRTVGRIEAAALLRAHRGPIVVVVVPGAVGVPKPFVLLAAGESEWDLHDPSLRSTVIARGIHADDVTTRIGAAEVEFFIAARLVVPEHAPYASPSARVLDLIVGEGGQIGLVYMYATLVGLFSLTLPLGVQAIIGLVSGGLILQPVVILVAFVVLGTLAYGVLQVMQLSVVETIQQRVFARFALEFAVRLPRLAMERRAGEDLSERMNRFFEVPTIQKSGAKLLIDGSTALLQVVFGLALLTVYHPYFALFGVSMVLLLALLFRWTGPRGLATSIKESTYKYRAVQWLEETARSAVAFKFAGRSTLPLTRMDEHVTGYLKYRGAHFGVLVQQKIAMIVFKTAITGGVLVLGSLLVIERQISLGQFVASEIVVVTVIAGIDKLIASLADVYDLLTSVEKIGHVRDLELEAAGGLAPSQTARGTAVGMAVGLRDVAFTYDGASAPTLRDITMQIAAGERIGVVGAFGSGESTLLRVVAGVYGGYDGTLTYDGVTRGDLDPTSLRASIGQVLPGETLFEGTVEENVSLGREGIDAMAVISVLRLVGADDFIQSLPHGLRTTVPPGGRTLPATIALRILLARAIVARPRLLVLDEAFSTLSPDDRAALTTMLTDAGVPWTLVAVSHDDDFLAACDRVLILRDGSVAAFGPWRDVSGALAAGEGGR